MLTPLPIDPALPELISRLKERGRLVLSAPPGSGKTTRLPRALLLHGAPFLGEILVLEPRRLPARLAAMRVAEELGEPVGKRVGYTVRFEDISSKETRLRFVTEGILTRRLLRDPDLVGTSVVVLDEFHERHLQGDLALALLRGRDRQRQHLGDQAGETASPSAQHRYLVVMSATLDAEALASTLDAAAGRAEGKPYEVRQLYVPDIDKRSLALQVASGIRQLAKETAGDILVFLPGAREIREVETQAASVARDHGLTMLPLHGDLATADQDRAVRKSLPGERKVILSTNIAESSVTIDGVTGVVDSGLARIARVDLWSGLPSLVTEPISRASAIQRAGRAGRTAPGVALRLYTKADFDARRESDPPEIERADLTATALELAAFPDVSPDWLTEPPTIAWQKAVALLTRIGALSDPATSPGMKPAPQPPAPAHAHAHAAAAAAAPPPPAPAHAAKPEPAQTMPRITALGRSMLQFPLHPRLSRLLLFAVAHGASESGAIAAALLQERDIRREARAFGKGDARPSESSDVIALLDLFREARDSGFSPSIVRAQGLDMGGLRTVERASKDLLRQVARMRDDARRSQHAQAHERPSDDDRGSDEIIQKALLLGFPDRVAKRRKSGDFALAGSGTSELAESSVVRHAPWIVAAAAEMGRGKPLIRIASAIEPEWLLDLLGDAVEARTRATWNEDKELAESVSELVYEGLVLDQSTSKQVTPEESELLYRMVKSKLHRFAEDLPRWEARVKRAATVDARIQIMSPEVLDQLLREACEGRRSFKEFSEAHIFDAIIASTQGSGRVHEVCPERITLPSGRTPSVEYEDGKPPFIESYLQDFCGLKESPKVAGEPLVMHLLAPNKRAVQVTTDLPSFWRVHYPSIRKELSRKYPRHAWPEDPSSPVPMKVRLPRS